MKLDGRKRLPEATKVVKGTQKPSRVNENAPAGTRGIPNVPKNLRDEGLELWHELTMSLDNMGVMCVEHKEALAELCHCYQTCIDTQALIDRDGYTYESVTKDGTVLIKGNPAVAMRSDAGRRLAQMLSHFGLSPATSSKINAVINGEEDDPTAKFFQ